MAMTVPASLERAYLHACVGVAERTSGSASWQHGGAGWRAATKRAGCERDRQTHGRACMGVSSGQKKQKHCAWRWGCTTCVRSHQSERPRTSRRCCHGRARGRTHEEAPEAEQGVGVAGTACAAAWRQSGVAGAMPGVAVAGVVVRLRGRVLVFAERTRDDGSASPACCQEPDEARTEVARQRRRRCTSGRQGLLSQHLTACDRQWRCKGRRLGATARAPHGAKQNRSVGVPARMAAGWQGAGALALASARRSLAGRRRKGGMAPHGASRVSVTSRLV